ncbi:EamA family transporter [Leucothrix arctica]|uniref:4-amino-4-deoxy-L-arabinose-phospho-UDP flippase n=1 Tax=Leucothrix arctica TaxID=1481894 RepID=A0A317CKW8_9GAMM|nr:EamA family transporter [Leucothrix arctica]PWQ96992.1 4-amino-4-deoxy-L-arabinose-phospho-UDP flippase [Leucothrix arctica]
MISIKNTENTICIGCVNVLKGVNQKSKWGKQGVLFSGDVLIVFILSILFTTSGQLLQKRASIKYSQNNGDGVLNNMLNADVVLSIIFLGLGLMFWLMVLTKIDLSLAYPLLSLNYIFILLGAKFLFKEAIPIHRWVGVGVILLGIKVLVGA